MSIWILKIIEFDLQLVVQRLPVEWLVMVLEYVLLAVGNLFETKKKKNKSEIIQLLLYYYYYGETNDKTKQ